MVNTNLFYRTMPAWAKALIQPVARLGYLTGRLRTPEQGAATAIFLATHSTPGGLYWADCRPREPNARSQYLPNAEVIRLPSAGHFVQEEAPQELNEAAARFMARAA